MNKKQSQTIHAKRRAAERHKINLTRYKIEQIIEQITTHKSIFIRKQSNRVAIHAVEIDGQYVEVVYDKQRKNIVTVLPATNKEYIKKEKMQTTQYLTIAETILLNNKLVNLYGGMGVDYGPPIGTGLLKDITMLESALNQPKFNYQYKSIPAKVGVYIFHLVRNHAFFDGNKRTAFAAGTIFGLLNQHNFISKEGLLDMVVEVAATDIQKEEFVLLCQNKLDKYPNEIKREDVLNFVINEYDKILRELANK